MSAAVTTELKTIGHWIGGENVQRLVGTKRADLQPCHGRADR